jgi:transposase
MAADLGIQVRFLPRATPELNAMDHLWRHVKEYALADRPTRSIDESANQACKYILDLSPRERLQKAGVLSGNFWLAR